MNIMSIVLILVGLVLSIYGLKSLNDFREEACGNHDSPWPENFLNVGFAGSGLMVFLIGCALWANVDLRLPGAMQIIIIMVGAASLLAIGIFLFNEKLMPKLSKKLERRRVKKEMEEKAWQDYLARSTPVIAPQAPAPVSAPQQIAPAQPMQAQSVQPVSQQFAPATAAAVQAQAQVAASTVLPIQSASSVLQEDEARAILNGELESYRLDCARTGLLSVFEKAEADRNFYEHRARCNAMLQNWQKLSSELQNWVFSQYNLGIAKIDEAYAAKLAPVQAQTRVIPVNKVSATTTGTANGSQNTFTEPEMATPSMRVPSRPAATKSKPTPNQPIKKSADPKKTTPPTARK